MSNSTISTIRAVFTIFVVRLFPFLLILICDVGKHVKNNNNNINYSGTLYLSLFSTLAQHEKARAPRAHANEKPNQLTVWLETWREPNEFFKYLPCK